MSSPSPKRLSGFAESARQMMLDLFGAGHESSASGTAEDSVQARPSPEAHAPLKSDSLLLPADTASVPESTPGHSSYSHPEANRSIVLGGQSVAYAFVRARRSSIGFSIDAKGLTVRAPRWVLVADVERALLGKGDWILRKLADSAERRERMQSGKIVWADGVQLPYLGRTLTVRVGPGPLAAPVAIFRWGRDRIGLRLQDAQDAAEGSSATPMSTLWVGLPASFSQQTLRDLVEAWLRQQAQQLFEQRLPIYAAPLGVRWKQLSLTSARTRWGSATSTGHIRLNWRLIHFRLPVIDYVVAHELSHLRVMDHSPRFWQTVESVMPDYAALRAELKRADAPQWD